MNCLFCDIAAKKIPAPVVNEDEDTLSFLDINPRAPGHTVVIPKVHAGTILDLEDRSLGSLFRAVKEVTGMIERSLKPDGFTIGINHGKSAGQAIDHVHVHVIPRWKSDGGGSIHTVVMNPSEDSPETIKEKILKNK